MRCDPGLELLHDAYCLPALLRRKFTHAELWAILGTVVDEGRGMTREEIGRSAEGRPIFAVRFGRVLVRGGTVVVPGLAPFRADVGVDFASPLDLRDGTVAAVGDLADSAGRRVVDASGLFVHPEPEALGGGRPVLDDGLPASFILRRGVEPESERVMAIRRGVVDRVEETDGEDGGAGKGR